MFRRLLALGYNVAKGFSTDRCSQRAAGISYYVLLSLFPLVLFTVAVVGLASGGAQLQKHLVDTVLDYLPTTSNGSSGNDVASALRDVSSGQNSAFGLVAVLGLAWGGSAMFSALRNALNDVFDAPEDPPLLLRKAVDLALVLALAPLFIASLALTAALHYASTTDVSIPVLGDLARGSSLFWPPLRFLLPLLLSFLAILAVYWLVPAERHPAADLVPGAVLAALLFETAKQLFGVYVDNFSNYAVVFGPLGAIVAFLIWIYLSTNILLLGAELAAALPDWRRQQPAMAPSQPGKPLWQQAAIEARNLLLRGKPRSP